MKAKEKLDFLKLDTEKRKSYEEYLKNLSIEKDIILDAREEGIKEGIEQGRLEANKKNALKMIGAGADSKLISEITGFTESEIQNLIDNQ